MGPNDAPAAEKKQDAKEVGVAFAKKYYEGAVRGPEGVMELFGNDSVYVGTNGKEAHGLEDIRTAIGNINLKEGKIVVESVHAAFTCNGGILVQSIANYAADDSTKYGFSEAFHLVPQKKGWYVHSCLFKWHDKSPEDVESKDALSSSVEEPNHELVNGHAETEKHTPEPESDAKVAEEVKKPSNERKGNHSKDRVLTNGTSTPPTTPSKNPPATPTKNPPATPSKNPATPQKDVKPPPPVTPTSPASAPTPPVLAPPPAPAAPASWAACVGGNAKTGAPASVQNNAPAKSLPATNSNNAASDVSLKSPTTTTTANANGNTSANADGFQDQHHRQRKPGRPKSDYTVHVSKIIKNKKAAEKDVAADLAKALQEFGAVGHVRVPGRRLANDAESTLYAFVDFKEKEDYEKVFADREQDNEGRVKVNISLPTLNFSGEVLIAQNHDRAAAQRNFYRNRRPSDNIRPGGNNGNARPGYNNGNARPGYNNGRPRNRRPSRNNGQPGNRPPYQTGNRNPSDNRRKENGNVKAKN